MASKAIVGILIGCLAVVFIGVIIFVAGGLYVKHKVESGVNTLKNVTGTQDSEYGKRAAKLKEQYPFTAPADGIIKEPQLQRYLEVRKGIFAVFKQHEPEIKTMEDSKADNIAGRNVFQSVSILNDLRMAQIKALEEQKMSQEEYVYLTSAVYTGYIAKVYKDALNKSQIDLSDSQKQNLQNQIDQIDKQIAENPNMQEDAKKQLEITKQMLQMQLTESQELKRINQGLESIPPSNLELFKKHDGEIRQYSMSGLELLGFF